MASFYLDEDISLWVAGALRQLDHRVVTTRDFGNEGQTDYQQLLTASQNSWVMVTHNAKDFGMLHGAWKLWQAAWGTHVTHAGVLVLAQARDETQRAEYARHLHELTEQTDRFANELYR